MKKIPFLSISQLYWLTRIGLPSILLMEGVDKFFNILTNWKIYIAPFFVPFIPFSLQYFLYMLGIGEIIIAVIALLYPRIGGWFIVFLLFSIICNLLLLGDYGNIILIDIGLIFTALTLITLDTQRRTSGK